MRATRTAILVLKPREGLVVEGALRGWLEDDPRFIVLATFQEELHVPATYMLQDAIAELGGNKHWLRIEFKGDRHVDFTWAPKKIKIWDVRVHLGKMPHGLSGSLRRQGRRLVRKSW